MTILGIITDLSTRVRQRRRELRMTQATLAQLASVSRYTVIKLESGQLADINLQTVLALLRPLELRLQIDEVGPVGLPVFGEDEPRR